jgi:hypothetical protein
VFLHPSQPEYQALMVRLHDRTSPPAPKSYGWMPHNASFGFLDLTPSILLLRQFWD